MTKLRSLSFAASLMAASVLVSPSFALDLGGTIGGTIGGSVGGSVGGNVGGTLDPVMRTGGRLGTINDRADETIDRAQSRAARAAGAIEVPEAPTTDEVNSALKAAGYADAALETPAASLSASGSAENPDAVAVPAAETPAVPDANAAVDRAQSARNAVAGEAVAAIPAETPVSASASLDAGGEIASAEPDAASAQPSGGGETSADDRAVRPERARGVRETEPRQY